MSNVKQQIQAVTGGRLLTRPGRQLYNDRMEKLRMVIMGNASVSGAELPRFGLYSILARRTPFYVYDHPVVNALCTTAFTDGTHVFFNADFFDQLKKWDREAEAEGRAGYNALFVGLHELSHILFRHHMRLEEFPPDIANIAADLSINTRLQIGFPDMQLHDGLRSLGYGFKPGDIQRYSERDEESIAHELATDQKKQPKQGQQGQGNQMGSGSPEQSSNPSEASKGGKPGTGKSGAASKKGKKDAQGGATPGAADSKDNHIVSMEDFIDILDNAGLNDVVDTLRLPRGKEGLENHQQQQGRNLRKDISDAADQKAKAGGKFPGGHIVDCAEEMIRELDRPKLNWKLAMREMILGDGTRYHECEELPGDLYYIDPSIMNMDHEVFIESQVPAKPDNVVVAVVDTSGSVDTNMLRDFFAEIFGLLQNESEQASEVVVFSADTVVRGQPMIINEYNYEQMVESIVAYGRGGTNFRTVMKEVLDMDLLKGRRISAMLYFTDLFDSPPTRAELPERIPPIRFITTPSKFVGEFRRRVIDYADVVEIVQGKTVDLDSALEQDVVAGPSP